MLSHRFRSEVDPPGSVSVELLFIKNPGRVESIKAGGFSGATWPAVINEGRLIFNI